MKYRHGDLIIQTIDRIPDGAQPTGSNVLAEGEATGHAHRYFGGVVMEHEGVRYGQPTEGETYLDHEDHGREDILSQPVKITIQREWDDEEEWRSVAD